MGIFIAERTQLFGSGNFSPGMSHRLSFRRDRTLSRGSKLTEGERRILGVTTMRACTERTAIGIRSVLETCIFFTLVDFSGFLGHVRDEKSGQITDRVRQRSETPWKLVYFLPWYIVRVSLDP